MENPANAVDLGAPNGFCGGFGLKVEIADGPPKAFVGLETAPEVKDG